VQEAVAVERVFKAWGDGMRISATVPQFYPNFFRFLPPIIKLRQKIHIPAIGFLSDVHIK
jgi:hypothetical protein